MSALNVDDPHVPEQLVDQLAKGYDALSFEMKRAHEHQRQLENRLAWAKQQVLDALKRHTPSTASKDFHEFLNELDEAGACQKEGDADWLETLVKSPDEESKARAYNIQRAEDAREKIRYRSRASELENGVKIWPARSGEECTALEKDFTTPGTPGKLGCPFASSGRTGRVSATGSLRGHSTPRSSISRGSIGRRSRRAASFHDPIKAELDHAPVRPVTAAESIEGSQSVPLCPIRFLDQHSPEEVARYFEKHKHELPKSHEICVKRFQENEEALRNLDSKYANIVSMVNDLGQMHQPMLPDPEELAIDEDDDDVMPNSASKVERWAQDVQHSDQAYEKEPDGDEVDREHRFDRSLKDVRVGESPSRPWGIHVPDDYQADGDGVSKKSDPTASPLEPATAVDEAQNVPPHPFMGTGRCPFSGAELKDPKPVEDPIKAATSAVKPTLDEEKEHHHVGTTEKSPMFMTNVPPQHHGPQLVFNGPVFFAYPVDQTMSLMQTYLAKRSGD